MKYTLMAVLGLLAAACSTDSSSGYDSGRQFDVTQLPHDLDARGVSFGIGGIPGERNTIALRVNFKISSTGEDAAPVTEEAWLEAAQKAAPKGCTLKALTPLPDGGRKAEYKC